MRTAENISETRFDMEVCQWHIFSLVNDMVPATMFIAGWAQIQEAWMVAQPTAEPHVAESLFVHKRLSRQVAVMSR